MPTDFLIEEHLDLATTRTALASVPRRCTTARTERLSRRISAREFVREPQNQPRLVTSHSIPKARRTR